MATISVSNVSGLTAAMAQAKAGDTILLASGNYGAFATGNDYASTVTIKSADAGSPATFSSVSLNGATGITFDTINFDYKYSAGDPTHVTPFSVRDSANIAFKNSVFDGDVASGLDAISNGYAVGRGLAISGSNGVTVENCEMKTWLRGMVVGSSDNINIVDNNIHSIRSDGMDFAQVTKVLIEGNYIHDFRGAPGSQDHADFIQFWTTGTTKPSTDITIRNNILDVGQGSWAQSIFIRNELVDLGKAGESMYYKNLLIENNTISNAHTHGITVGETDGLIIRNNILTAADLNMANPVNAAYVDRAGGLTAGILVPKILLKGESDNLVVTGNAFVDAPWYTGPRLSGFTSQSDWKVSGNTQYANEGSVPAGTGASGSGSTPTPTPTPMPTPTPTPESPPEPTPTPTPVPVSKLPVIDDYVLNIATLPKAALKDSAKVVTIDGEKMISLDGTKDYVALGRLRAFEKAEVISFEIDFSRDVADGKDARLVWNHMKYGLTLSGDGLVINVATAREGFKTIRVDNLGLNDTDNHSIRVILDSVSNRLQVVLDGKVVFNTTSTDLKFVGAGGHEAGWTLGTPWNRFFDGEISDFRVEAKADFISNSTTLAPVAAMASQTTLMKAPTGGLVGTSSVTKVAMAEKAVAPASATDTTKIAASETDDAVNAKLASLFWGGASKTYAVNEKGDLIQTTSEKSETALASLDVFNAMTAPPAAKVVIDTAADSMTVVSYQTVAQNDDDLDVLMATGGDTSATGAVGVVSDAPVHIADAVHTLDAGSLDHQVLDGHSMFA